MNEASTKENASVSLWIQVIIIPVILFVMREESI